MRKEATIEQSLVTLAQLAGDVIEAEGPDQRETLWFEPGVGSYL